jgi:hypothetical protein
MTDHTKGMSDAQMASAALQREHGIGPNEAAALIVNDPALDVGALAAQERQRANTEIEAQRQAEFEKSPEGRARKAQRALEVADQKAKLAASARALLVDEGMSPEAAAEMTDLEARQAAGVEALPFHQRSRGERWREQERVAHMDGFEELPLGAQQDLAHSVGMTPGEIIRYRKQFVGAEVGDVG